MSHAVVRVCNWQRSNVGLLANWAKNPNKPPIFENPPGRPDKGQKEDVSGETRTYGNPKSVDQSIYAKIQTLAAVVARSSRSTDALAGLGIARLTRTAAFVRTVVAVTTPRTLCARQHYIYIVFYSPKVTVQTCSGIGGMKHAAI